MADSTRVIRVVVDNTGTERSTRQAIRALGTLERQLNQVRAATQQLRTVAAAGIGFVGLNTLGAGATEFIRSVIDVAQSFEQLEARLTTFEGSTDAARAKLAELEELNRRLPSTVDGLVTAYLTLKSAGLDPSTQSLVALSDAAAATGKDLQQVAEAVVDAAGGSGFERLKELGVRVKDFGDTVTITFGGMSQRVAKESGAIQRALEALFTREFGGTVGRQVDSLTTALSNLQDAQTAFLRTAAQAGIADAVNELARTLTAATEGSNSLAVSVGQTLRAAIEGVSSVVKSTNGDFVALIETVAEASATIVGVFGGARLGRNLGPAGAVAGGIIGGVVGKTAADDAFTTTAEIKEQTEALRAYDEQIRRLESDMARLSAANIEIPQDFFTQLADARQKVEELRASLAKEGVGLMIEPTLDDAAARSVAAKAQALGQATSDALAAATPPSLSRDAQVQAFMLEQRRQQVINLTEELEGYREEVRLANLLGLEPVKDDAQAKVDQLLAKLQELRSLPEIKSLDTVPGLPEQTTIAATAASLRTVDEQLQSLGQSSAKPADVGYFVNLQKELAGTDEAIKRTEAQLASLQARADQQTKITGQVDPTLRTEIERATAALDGYKATLVDLTVQQQEAALQSPVEAKAAEQLRSQAAATQAVTRALDDEANAIGKVGAAAGDTQRALADLRQEQQAQRREAQNAVDAYLADLKTQLADQERLLAAARTSQDAFVREQSQQETTISIRQLRQDVGPDNQDLVTANEEQIREQSRRVGEYRLEVDRVRTAWDVVRDAIATTGDEATQRMRAIDTEIAEILVSVSLLEQPYDLVREKVEALAAEHERLRATIVDTSEVTQRLGDSAASLSSVANPYAQLISGAQQFSRANDALMQQAPNIGEAFKSGLQGASEILSFVGDQAKTLGIESAQFQKALAVSQATVNAALAITNVLANVPAPANLALAATIAALTGAQIARIVSTDVSGRALGGPVNAGQIYRVGEQGPELYRDFTGRNYMIPGEGGNIVPNNRLGGNITINNYAGAQVSANTDPNGDVTVVIEAAVQAVRKDFDNQMSKGYGTYPSAIRRNVAAGRRIG
jgi:hypothetical protein